MLRPWLARMKPERLILFVSILIGTAPLLDAAALGLGDATLESRLNEPLDVEVALIGLDHDAPEPNAAIASEAMHAAAGIISVELLRGLRADVSARAGGEAHVRITSDQAIREPVVRFLLVVENAREHVTREYTLLLDPPGYSLPTTTTTVPLPERVSVPKATVAPASTPQTVHDPEQFGPVLAGDTLSKLAMRLKKEPDVTWAQMAWALYRFNPRAFIGGDINMLRSDVYLRVPTPETASRWSHRQALALIKANPGPASTAAVSTPDPRTRSQSSAVIASPVTDDRAALSNSPKEESSEVVPESVAKAESELSRPLFRLLPPATIGSTRSDGYVSAPMSARDQERVNQLLAQENRQIRESREEIARAREQLDDTARQISALVDTMEKKDSEIKGLETRLADLREFVRQQSIAMATPESPWLNRLVLEALLLAAMVGVLAVTLSRWSHAGRRNERNAYEGTIALELPAPMSNPNQSPPEVAELEIDTPLPEEECQVEPAVGDEPVIDRTEYEEIELRGDPLMEANAYLAYGYHDKAKEVLVDFIKEEPAHAEGRLLMLRVLHTIREKRTFRRHAEALLELVDDRFDERWMEVARLGRALLPEERLFDADVHQRADDEKWEETVWTGSRPDLTDCDDHIYLDIDEFKYVDLFLLDGAEDAGNDSAPGPSIDVASESKDSEADLAKWRVKMMGGSESKGFKFEPDGAGDDSSDDEQV